MPGRRKLNGSTGTAPVLVLVSVGVRVATGSRAPGSGLSLGTGAVGLSLGTGAALSGSAAPTGVYDAVLAVGLVRGVVLTVAGLSFGSGAPTAA